MGALKHSVQFILHTCLGLAPRACPSSPGNAWPGVAQAFNVHVVRVSAQLDQADEVVVWNVVSSNAWSTRPVFALHRQVGPKIGVVGAERDIRAGSSAWVCVQASPNNVMLVLPPQTQTLLNVHNTIRLQRVRRQITDCP